MTNLDARLAAIDQARQRLDALRLLPAATLRSLHEDLVLPWTHHANAIEGNTLTLLETRLVLLDGLTVSGKRLREHFEAINHRDAIEYVMAVVRNAEPFGEWSCALHICTCTSSTATAGPRGC